MTDAAPLDLGPEATSQEKLEAEETESHWAEWVKRVLVILKVSLICFLMANAIYYRRKKFGRYDIVTAMLVINIFVLLGLLAFEFGTKYIFGFFALVLLANYCNFLGFMIMVRGIKTPE